SQHNRCVFDEVRGAEVVPTINKTVTLNCVIWSEPKVDSVFAKRSCAPKRGRAQRFMITVMIDPQKGF
ncbi:MAG: hypothetical protein ACI9FJ_001503, partial [Alteromonadaceae bacterium]